MWGKTMGFPMTMLYIADTSTLVVGYRVQHLGSREVVFDISGNIRAVSETRSTRALFQTRASSLLGRPWRPSDAASRTRVSRCRGWILLGRSHVRSQLFRQILRYPPLPIGRTNSCRMLQIAEESADPVGEKQIRDIGELVVKR